MPTVKTPEERGPLGAWAYEARLAVNMSPEEVVHALGKYDAATIRKAESDSRNMSRPLWRSLVPLYQERAKGRGLALGLPPALGAEPAVASDQSAVAAAIDRQTVEIARQADAISELVLELRKVAWGQYDLSQDVATVVARLTARPTPGASPAATPADVPPGEPAGSRPASAGTK